MKEKLIQWIRKHKEIVASFVIVAGILCFFLVNDFQSKEDYYNVTLNTVQDAGDKENQTGTSEEILSDNSIEVTNEQDSESSENELTETREWNTTSEIQSDNMDTDRTRYFETDVVEPTETIPNIQPTPAVTTENQNLQTTENTTTTKKNEPTEKDAEIITVYISIDCKNILNNMDNLSNYDAMKSLIPEDGIVWKKTGCQVEAGITVFDLLEIVTKANKIQLDYQGEAGNIYGTIYVKGIDHIYEKTCGSSSGWMYTLNGEWIGVGCNSKKLKDGDYVQWRFTCDGGSDLRNK